MSPRAKIYIDANGNRRFATEKEFLLHRHLPYGMWTCSGGREVLFNRYYEPIWERLDDLTMRCSDLAEWVPWRNQEWFFNDGNPPWYKQSTMVKCLQELKQFGATWEPIVRYASVRHAMEKL